MKTRQGETREWLQMAGRGAASYIIDLAVVEAQKAERKCTSIGGLVMHRQSLSPDAEEALCLVWPSFVARQVPSALPARLAAKCSSVGHLAVRACALGRPGNCECATHRQNTSSSAAINVQL